MLPAALLGWYCCNSFFNVYNKQALTAFNYPWVVSWLQLLVGVAYAMPAWASRLRARPRVDARFVVREFGPIAVLHSSGHAAQVFAMGYGTVFMANVVKACEPVVGALVAWLGTGAVPSLATSLSLVPIVTGVALAASKGSPRPDDLLTVSSLTSLASTVVFAVAKLLAKRLMTPDTKKRRCLYPANNYALLTCCSCALLAIPAAFQAPAAILTFCQCDTTLQRRILVNITVSGAAYYFSNECSFAVLDQIGPVSQAVANAAKRVFVLVAAVLFLGETVTPIKATGSAIALFGVLLYGLSRASPSKSKGKAA